MNVLPVQSSRVAYRTSRSLLAAAASVALLALSLTFPSVASAGSDLVICHANNSDSNPYITNSPDKTADAGGHAGHTGPVWNPSLKENHDSWGDIIPPFDIDGGGHFNGLNWSVDGQEIWLNNCNKVNPDLKMAKGSSGDATVGTSGSYTLDVSNIGNGTAHAPFTVTDTMPPGVVATAVSGAGVDWTCHLVNAGLGISCTRSANLAPKAAASTITVTVNWGTIGTKSNTGSVEVLPDDPSGNNSDTASSTVRAAVLSGTVVKTSNADGNATWSDDETTTAAAGSTVAYQAEITNTSAVQVGLSISDTYGAGPAGTGTTITPTCNPAAPSVLAAGASFTCNFQVPGSSPTAGGSTVDTFTATMTATGSTTVTPHDSATVRKAAPAVLSGTVVKTSNADGNATWSDDETTTAAAGSTVSYQAEITNNSSVEVGLSLSDTYGAGPAGTGTTITPTCNPAAPSVLAAGASFTCNFQVPGSSPAAGGSTVDTFTATMTATGSTTVTPHDSATVRKAVPAVLSGTVVKTSNADGNATWSDDETTTAAAGSTLSYQAEITNNSGVEVGLSLSDTYGPGPGGTGTTITPTCNPAAPSVLAAGASFTCNFQVPGSSPAAGGSTVDTFTATMTATGSTTVTPHDSATVRKAEDNPSATIVKTNDADGNHTFSTSEVATSEGQLVRFKLHVTNTSPYAINVGQSISDKVWLGEEEPATQEPTAFQCEDAITNLAPAASADCFFDVPSYAAGDGAHKFDRATLTLAKYVPPPTQFASLRRITAAAVAAPPAVFTATSNVSQVTTTFPRVTAVPPTVNASQCVNGSPTAPSFTVPVTPGVVYSPAVGGVGAPGGSTSVTATAAKGLVLTNPNDSPYPVVFGQLASCGGNPPPPPVVVPTPPTPAPAPDGNLGISKTGPGSAHPGDELVYAIDVKNVKGTPATAFTVTDLLPAGLSYSLAEGTDFTCANSGQAITCVYSGTLAVGQSATIHVRALLDSAYQGTKVDNTAIVDPGRADTDPGDNSATATTDVVATPISGGGGGAAEEPVSSPTPAPEPAGDGGGAGLPFTGANSVGVLQLGVSLLLVGLFVALLARRRRTSTE